MLLVHAVMHFQARIEILVFFFVKISDISGPKTISGTDYRLVGISRKFWHNLQNISEILVQMRYISKKIEGRATHGDDGGKHKKSLIYLRFFEKVGDFFENKSLIFFKVFLF